MGYPRCAVCNGAFDHGTVGVSVGVLRGEVVGLVLFHNVSNNKLQRNNGQLCNGVKGILNVTKGIDSRFAGVGSDVQWLSVTGRVEDVVSVLYMGFKRWSPEAAEQLRDMEWIRRTEKRRRQIDVQEAGVVCASLGVRDRRCKIGDWYYVRSGRTLLRIPTAVNALLEKHGYAGMHALALLFSVMKGRYWVGVCKYLEEFAPGTMKSWLPRIESMVDVLIAGGRTNFTASNLLPLLKEMSSSNRRRV